MRTGVFQRGAGADIFQGVARSMAEFGFEKAVEVFLVGETVPPGDLGDVRLRPIWICQHLVGAVQSPALYLPHDAAAAFK